MNRSHIIREMADAFITHLEKDADNLPRDRAMFMGQEYAKGYKDGFQSSRKLYAKPARVVVVDSDGADPSLEEIKGRIEELTGLKVVFAHPDDVEFKPYVESLGNSMRYENAPPYLRDLVDKVVNDPEFHFTHIDDREAEAEAEAEDECEPFKLGDMVEDIPTGFEGVATAYAEHLGGFVQVEISPKSINNQKPDGEWFNLNRIKKV